MRRTALSLAALGLAAASCGVLPDDHALPQSLGRSLQRAVNGVHSITRSVESGSRRLATLPAKVAAIPDATARGLRQLQGTGERFVANGQVRLQRAVPRIGQNLGALGESGIGRTRALAGKPAQIAGGLGPSMANLQRAVWSVPSVLRLDRTPMPTAGDPERTVELYPSSRRRSWLERALDRMSF